MLGLKETTDLNDERFVRFFAEIQKAAAAEGCVFFAWSGEGHEFSDGDMDGEDMSGWLIPVSDASEFERQWRNGDDAIDGRFADLLKFAIWEKSGGEVSVSFKDTR